MAVSVAGRSVRPNTMGLAGLASIALAWAVSIWVELSGNAAQLHHHALYESGRPSLACCTRSFWAPGNS